jgi:hypothetical protein
MARSKGAGPPKLKIYFSDLFGVSKSALEKYGALNVSLLADLPLFVDPFLCCFESYLGSGAHLVKGN